MAGSVPRRRAGWVAAAIALAASPARGSPIVPLDDPVYDLLDQRALAAVALPPGGLAPLTEARVRALLPEAPAAPTGWWLRPVERAALELALVDEAARGYATAARPRDVAGVLALSCERRAGQPCGDGHGLGAELDAAAGYGPWASAAARLRATTGRAAYATGLELDRGYVGLELGPITATLGRDVLVVGPATRTQLGWGTNAPPLDQVRLAGARPLALGWARVNARYAVGRLAPPQAYPGALVSVARLELELGDRVAVGATQLLQLGGAGAPRLGVVDFVLEHVRRRDASASATDSSNRRVGLDVAVALAGLGGTRLTYQLMFEDLRTRVVDAVRHDADHALELHTRWLTVELRRTGVRAYEHVPRVTGFTNGGRIVGDPLGPAALAVFAGGRIPARWGVVVPWLELAQLSSDTYRFEDEAIVRTRASPHELRIRIGARARLPLGHGLELGAELMLEDVERAAFVPGARARNAGARLALTWRGAALPEARPGP